MIFFDAISNFMLSITVLCLVGAKLNQSNIWIFLREGALIKFFNFSGNEISKGMAIKHFSYENGVLVEFEVWRILDIQSWNLDFEIKRSKVTLELKIEIFNFSKNPKQIWIQPNKTLEVRT